MCIKKKGLVSSLVGFLILIISIHGSANEDINNSLKQLEELIQNQHVSEPKRIDIIWVPINSSKKELEAISSGDNKLQIAINKQIQRLKRDPTANASAMAYQFSSGIPTDKCVIVYSPSEIINSGNATTLRHELGHCFQNYLAYDVSSNGKQCSTFGKKARLCEHHTTRNLWNRYNQELMTELTTAILEFKKNGHFQWLNERIKDYEFKFNLPAYSLGKPLLDEFEKFVTSKVAADKNLFEKMNVFQAVDYIHEQYFLPNALSEKVFDKKCQERKSKYKQLEINCGL